MQYRLDPRSGNSLSVLGYGCMRFTRRAAAIDQEKAEREMALALEKGVNYFDTAWIYPGSEVCLGKFLKNAGYRDRVFIATKLPQYRVRSLEEAENFFREELERLGTDSIDYYLMHMLNDAASWERLCSLGMEDWLLKKKKEGRIRNIGFSFHGGTAQFKALLDSWDWDLCQIQFNYMDEHSQAGLEGLRYASAKGLPVVIMEPLRGGRLVNGLPANALREFEAVKAGRSAAEWGLRWVWDHPEVSVVLSGMNDVSQIEENCRTASESLPGHLTEEELQVYPRVLKAIYGVTHVGCTGCGYCQPCPKGVNIPTCFALYNASYVDGLISAMREYFMCTTLRSVRSNAGLCVGCGACEKHCPQGLPIRQELKNVRKRLENPIYRIAQKVAPKIMKY